MGEHSIIEIAEALDAGIHVRDITFIAGTVYKTRMLDEAVDTIVLPSYEKLKEDKLWYARSFIHSTVIPTHLPESGLRSLTESIFILCRIRQQNHLRRWKWMMSMHYLIKNLAIRPTMQGRRSGNLGSQIQPGQQPRLFWRMQFLCADVPSGPDHSDERA